MISEHPHCQPPDDSQVIWKYLSLEGFIWILQNKALWFSNVNRFEDPFEGTFVDQVRTGLNSVVATIPFTIGRRSNPEDEKNSLLVHCWHMSEEESYAMWKIYSDVEIGIALKTTFGKLTSSLQNEGREVFAGKVNYERRSQAAIRTNSFQSFLRKDPVFSFENELRFLVTNENDPINGYSSGKAFPFAPTKGLIEILISPYSKPWQRELIRNLLINYDLNIPINISDAASP